MGRRKAIDHVDGALVALSKALTLLDSGWTEEQLAAVAVMWPQLLARLTDEQLDWLEAQIVKIEGMHADQ